MEITNLQIKIIKVEIEDAIQKEWGIVHNKGKKYKHEDYARKLFENDGWNVIKPVTQLKEYKETLKHLQRSNKELKKVYDEVKNLKSIFNSENNWHRSLLGMPDFFMCKDWSIDKEDNLVYTPEYRYVEIKSKNVGISANQIKWGIYHNLKELYYVYVIVPMKE